MPHLIFKVPFVSSAQVFARALREQGRDMRKQSILNRTLALMLATTFLVVETIAAVRYPELPDPGKAPISKEEQMKMGEQAAAEVYKQMPVLPDNSPETQYVRQLGERLVAQIPQQYSWPFRFHVIPQKDINAFALPGGEMFVNVGAITAAKNEAQLAGVMSHEMSHVYMQHSAKQMGKASTLQGLAGLAGAILGGTNSVWGGLARAGVQIGAGTVMMKYSRTDEAQADAVGAIIMYKAGYNPIELANFFETLAQQSGNGGPQFLSDHPNPGNRYEAIRKEVAEWPQKNFQGNSSAFLNARNHAQTQKLYTAQEIQDGAKSGQWAQLNQKSGAVFSQNPGAPVVATPASSQGNGHISNISASDIRPSGNFKNLNLDFIQMKYPDNWQASGDQQQSSVTIAPPAGVSGNAIAYGVTVNGAAPPNGESMNLDQMTGEIIRSLQQGNEGLQQIGQPQTITVNGVHGRSVDLSSTSPIQGSNGQRQSERDWLVTLPRNDGSVVFLVFIAPQNDFDNLRPTYESMLRSVRLE
jgi:Zn-dependent protease with chaperone function